MDSLRTYILLIISCIAFCSNKTFAQANNNLPVDKIVQLAEEKYRSFINHYNNPLVHLYSFDDDSALLTVNYKDWTSGFFSGCLWYLYGFSNNSEWKHYADEWTNNLQPASLLTNKHDLGFMLFTSFGNGLRFTADSAYKKILLQGAKSLSKRFNPAIGSIRSWDNGPWHYPVIVDNLMNLELLFWAAQTFHDSSFFNIAISHINNDLKYRFRKDGSTFHVLDFDSASGMLLTQKTWQGYSDASCWARGQAWAIYSLTMAYRYTHNKNYLSFAEKAAQYFIHQINKIPDHIPYWDFNDPGIPNIEKDVSAAAVAASALIELSNYTPTSRKLYYNTALQMLTSLCSDKYLCFSNAAPNQYFLLRHSVVNKPRNKGVDVPVIYADYYFLEALWRYKHYKDK
ncbi:glycoside hydrolase family 88 protein [Parafilimonas terrae]|uniref:Glycosyl Hydrolase Family 88 n=1 Tax=Parafilimonas terrae TaxID=1465490 RepID=A0A1I5Y1Y8_9BACT|nr:glycoside hydrolase family 88 protein [Parafilimonas terrae]SFQ38176.1 Glycosyl Hydrolase Family 88 [Parafilimonas terrae]